MFVKRPGWAEGEHSSELAGTIVKDLRVKYEGGVIELTDEEFITIQMLRDLPAHDQQRIIHMLQIAWAAGKVDQD